MATNLRVLVVDQDPEVRFQVQQLVREAGFDVDGEAGLGTEAVAAATELTPDIVLCGLKEPAARALQTIEAITHVLPETPLIVYSESSELAVVRQAMLAGARDFLQAPFTPEELRRSLAAALESEERKRLRDAGGSGLGPQGAIITIFGAKGGVGKTTVAANLGVALVRQGMHTAVLVDADDTFGDAAASLALRNERSITDALRELDGAEGVGLSRFLSHHDSGLAVLPGPASPFEWRGFTGEQLQQALRQLARQFDVVLVDTGGSLSDVSLAALESASLILWITTPDFASVHDALRALQAIRSRRPPDDRTRIVLNVTSPEMEVSPGSIEEAMGQEIFWTVPYDRQVRRSTQLGQPLVDAHPRSPAAISLADLALVLSGAPPEPSKDGFLRRLFGNHEARLPKRGRWQEVHS